MPSATCRTLPLQRVPEKPWQPPRLLVGGEVEELARHRCSLRVGDKPGRFGQDVALAVEQIAGMEVVGKGGEVAIDDALLRPVEEKRIVDQTDAAARVFQCVAGETTPSGLGEHKTRRCPDVDVDAAVAQIGQGLLEGVAVTGESSRMDDNIGGQCAPQPLVAEDDGPAQEFSRIGSRQTGLGQGITKLQKNSSRKARSSAVGSRPVMSTGSPG